ncbi:multisubunit sodium/proton antiporter MrpE subunit [Psychrobacillus insolitus]|uniref:Multisubunit sodium/proton antiporter MrpE subunit n=1 Tax=Psychrobacillus insolitus TaxID=1461 RepID=A0A2W7MEL5_9BACI|nr:Na+/H+ antiporter subunit E [Psychrobacillus insolitus]PZX03927.1 multisubunit sodium/proton antiporter MrpE subunit [Psychrobacillus insolitus]
MPAQFLLNLFIAFLWMLLKDEDELRISTFIGGFLVGIVIIFLMHRFFGSQFYLRRLFSIINLLFIFNWELILSSILIIKQILSPKLDIKPGIFTYKTELQGDWELTVLAMLLTLTPGSVVLEVNPDGDIFYIHAMDIEKSKADVLRSIGKFERAILEVTR